MDIPVSAADSWKQTNSHNSSLFLSWPIITWRTACRQLESLAPMNVIYPESGTLQWIQTWSRQKNKSDIKEALVMLIHLVGDLHQTLHLGFREAIGGGVYLSSCNTSLGIASSFQMVNQISPYIQYGTSSHLRKELRISLDCYRPRIWSQRIDCI